MNSLSCRSNGWAPLSYFLGAVLAFGAWHSVWAQSDQNWLTAGPSDTWDISSNNWDSGTVWVDGNNAIFGGVGETIGLGSDVTVNFLTFNSDGYVIEDPSTAGVLSLSASSQITVTNATDSATISEDLTVGGIDKLGSGTLILSGNNSFDGAVTVSAGRLTAGSNTALGTATGDTSVSSGAQLRLADGVIVSGETINITGSGIDFSGAINVASGDSAEWSGDIVNTSARVGAGAGGVLTLSGGISGNSLTFSSFGTAAGSGAGAVVIGGTTKTYSGNTNIIRGILRLGADEVLPTGTVLRIDTSTAAEDSIFDLAGFDETVIGLERGSTGGDGGAIITNSGGSVSTLTVNQSAGTRIYSGSIENGASAVNLTKLGNGTLELSGASTTSGEIRVEAGELRISHDQALGDTIGETVATSGGRIVLADGVTISGETARIVGTGGNNNGAIQTVANGTATWDGNIEIVGNNTRVGGGVNGTLNVNGVISGASNRTIVFSRGNDATTVLNAVNTYTGDTQMFANGGTGATLRLGIDNAINSQSRFSMLTANATQQMNLDFAGFDLALRGIDTSNRHDRGGNVLFSNETASTQSVFTITGTTEDLNSTAIIADGASGAGGMSLVKEGGSSQTLLGANTYTGSTTVRGGTLRIGRSVSTFGSGGSLASTDIRMEGGTFELNNLGTSNNNNDRLSDTATLRFLGGDLLFLGSDQAATDSNEEVGSLLFEEGISTATVRYGGTNVAELLAGTITRPSLGGLGFINGLDLGKDGTSTSSIARIKATTIPTLVGSTAALSTGINAAAQDTEIVPFLVGSADTATGGVGTEGATPNTFLTYHSDTGLRPLNPTDEFTNNSVVAGDNIRVTGTTQATSNVSINSLVLDGGDFDVLNGSTVTVASGAILFASGTSREIGGSLANTTLDFGAREGIVTINSTGNTSIRPAITGTGGLSVYGSGRYIPRNSRSDYSGGTLLQVAEVIPTTSSIGPAGAPTSGPFGTGIVILDGSAIRSTTTAATTIANELVIRSDTEILATGGAKSLILTGPVTLEEGDRVLSHNSSADTIFSGAIGDGGNAFGFTVDGSGTGSVILEGANTYTGDTSVESGTLQVDGSTSAASNVSVASGATLGGAGTVGGNTTVSGTLSAGTVGTIDSLDFTNDLTINSGANWLVDLVGGSGSPGSADLVNVGGALDISGATLAINYESGSWNYGDKFTIATYASLTGEFFGLANGTRVDLGDGADMLYFISYADGGGAITLTAVPEPSTWTGLAVVFCIALFLYRKRRHQQAVVEDHA